MSAARLALACLLACGVPARAAADAVESAMKAELARSMEGLKQDGYPSPYFISLAAIDVRSWESRGVLGSPYFSGEYVQRIIVPDLRVGGYEFDNHPVSNPTGFQGRGAAYDEDEEALRYGLWHQLDAAYKTASAEFLRKQALRVSRGKTDYDTDDLTKESPRSRTAARPASAWDTAGIERLTRKAGEVMRRRPGLLSADVSARLRRQWTRYRDTEGSAVDFGRDVAELELETSLRADDGTKIFSGRKFVATTPSGLPSEADVAAAAEEAIKDLEALRVAATTSPFSAPALLDPSVSAAVVLAIGLRLSGEEQRNPSGSQTFRGKLGTAVLPKEFTLVDDPLQASYKGTPLAGHYEFDDQAVPAQRVVLVEDGILKGMLLSRYPVVGMAKSNGHARAFAGYSPEGMPGALFLTTKKPRPQAELLERLREECRKAKKPYGIWVRRLRGFSQQQGTGGHASIRFQGSLIYLVEAATGKLTLVRDLDLVGTPHVLLNNVRAGGDDALARNMVYGAPVSVITPSLLLADAELQRAEGRPEKQPILPPPPAQASGPRPMPRVVPTVPVVAHVQIQRYVVRGFGRLLPRFVVKGVADSRQHLEGSDLHLDFKAVGPNLPELGATVRRLDEAVRKLADGKPVETKTLWNTSTLSSYEAANGKGWPAE